MTFAQRVKKVRLHLMFSQEEFAKQLGVGYQTIIRWESGKFEPNFAHQRLFKEFCLKHKIDF